MSALDDTVPDEIGGYRVVRLLAGGSRALTVLVHAEGESRVARVFSSTCPASVIDSEVAVLDAIEASEPALRNHAAALDDLVTLPNGRLALLLQQVAGPRLDDVIALRGGRLEVGEAITVLAPLIDALDAAHRFGLTGLGFNASSIRFSVSGAPVIVRVQDAVAGPVLPQRFRVLEPSYSADLAAFVRLGEAVATAVVEPYRAALLSALRSTSSEAPRAHRLFDLAEPLPIRLDGPPADSAVLDSTEVNLTLMGPAQKTATQTRATQTNSTVTHPHPRQPSTAVPPDSPSVRPANPMLQRPARLVLTTLGELGLPPTVIAPVANALDRVGAIGDRVSGALRGRSRTVRPRFLIAGAAGVVSLVLALVLTAGLGGAPARPAVDAGASGASESDSGPVEAGVAPSMPPIDRTSMPESAVHPEADEWQGIVEALVDRWMRCHETATATCALEVVHIGSAAERLLFADDARHALLESWRSVEGEAVVIERMGGAVLIDLVTVGTTTVSLLLVRSEAGWRLRDVMA